MTSPLEQCRDALKRCRFDSPNMTMDDMRFIRDAIAAADAALAAQPEPVAPKWWIAVLDDDQRPQQLQSNLHEVGFRNKRSADGFIASELDFKGWRYTLHPLYAAPVAAPVAQPLTELAQKYASQNPLGGPAKVFDACADAIRAGDDVDRAMANFGLAWAPKEPA